MSQMSVKSLYEEDFSLWLEKTVRQLKEGDFQQVDWQNLIEEIEALGKSQRRAIRSFLQRLLELLLKRRYVPLSSCYRAWEIEIRNFRESLEWELEDSPSLRGFILEILERSYDKALKNVRQDYPDVNFPDLFPFSKDVERLLTSKFWH